MLQGYITVKIDSKISQETNVITPFKIPFRSPRNGIFYFALILKGVYKLSPLSKLLKYCLILSITLLVTLFQLQLYSLFKHKMHKLYLKLVALLFLTLASCQQQGKQHKIVAENTTNASTKQIVDSMSIDLLALQQEGKLKNTHLVTVQDDPVYHSIKRYQAVALSKLLSSYTAIKTIDPKNYQIVFECEDGYKPMMPLQKIMDSKAYVAVSDIDAPKGQLWSEIIKDGHEMKAAPFYLIYEAVPANETDYKWPYNLVKIQLVNNSLNIALIAPKDDPKAQAGFDLFDKNCVTCHAINKIGGTMGPELNYPKSVTEYWKKDQLKKFIQHPASFRNDVKMPTLTNITPRDIDQIFYYLEYMSYHKI